MTESAAEAWPEPPLAGTEAAAVLGALERQRATLAWKCSGLDAAGLRATVGASAVTLGGLLKHLAHVEDSHFARLWLGVPVGAPWDAVDWDNDPDWAYRSAAQDTPGQLRTLWRESAARSRATVDAALRAGGGFPFPGPESDRCGHPWGGNGCRRPSAMKILAVLARFRRWDMATQV